MNRRSILFTYILLIIGTIIFTLPFYWMIATSFKTPVEAVKFPPTWFPNHLRLSNYVEAFKVAPFLRYFINTIVITIFTVICVLITSIISGFVFAFYEFRFKELLFLLFLSMMMVPMPVYIVPGYLILARFGWLDTYLALIVPWGVNIFAIFMLRQHFKIIPKSLLEAAIIDGCSIFGFLRKIAVPLVKPAIITIVIFDILSSWNSFVWPLVMTNSDKIRPVQVGLAYFMQEESTNYPLLSAASTLVVIPVIIIYLLFQKKITESYMRSGIKE